MTEATKAADIELTAVSDESKVATTKKAGTYESCPPAQKNNPSFGIDKRTLKGLVGNRENLNDAGEHDFVAEVAALGGVSGLLQKLGTDLAGINEETVAKRHDAYGFNKIPDRKLKTFFELIWGALQDPTLILLIASGSIQLLLAYIPATASTCDVYPSTHAWVEPFAIYMAVCVVCFVAAGTDYAKQLQMKEQQDKKNKMSKYSVTRDGKTVECQKTDLVVGDIVELGIGAIVPADAYFLTGKDFQLDESALTGEPHLMNKTTEKPWLLSGTQVKNGTGQVLIVAVGPLSVSGEITMKVLGLTDADLEDGGEVESCMVSWGCASPPPVDERLTSDQPAVIKKVVGQGKVAMYTVEYTKHGEFLNVAKYTEEVRFDQIDGLREENHADGDDVEAQKQDDDDEPKVVATLAVGATANIVPLKIKGEEGEGPVSGLEVKLEDMANAITSFGFLLALISMVFASIIWAILKFGSGKTTAIPAGNSLSRFIVDASFWADGECSDKSLRACYDCHTGAGPCPAPDHHRRMLEAAAPVFEEGQNFCKDFFSNATGVMTATVGCKDFGAKFDPQKIVRILVTGITILVVAIPEGLPLAVTLAIAFAQKKLFKLNNFVKTLDSCETMGSATTICSDKTGTLTQNRMTAMNVYLGNKNYAGTTTNHVGTMLKDSKDVSPEVTKLLAHSCAINSSDSSQLVAAIDVLQAAIAQGEKPVADEAPSAKSTRLAKLANDKEDLAAAKRIPKPKVQNGNKTECGLLGLVEAMGEDYMAIRQAPEYAAEDGLEWGRNAGDGDGKGNPAAFPFSSSRKRMSWLVPHGEDQLRMHCKGASEVVLARCTTFLDADGTTKPITEEMKATFLETLISYANQGKRTLALSYRDFAKDVNLMEEWVEAEDGAKKEKQGDAVVDYAVEHDLTLIAIVGIADPLRAGVKTAISKCFTAGVDVRMVTGDQINTAIAISTEAGILREEHFSHVFSSEQKSGGNKKYIDLLEKKFMAITEIKKEMKSDGKSDADTAAFEKACVEARGITKKDEAGQDYVETDPVQYVRPNFAMEGRTFAQAVYYGNTTTGEASNAPQYSYKGTPYEKKVAIGHVNQEALDSIWPKLRVMSRCQPQDKLTLVKGLMDSDLYAMEEKVNMLRNVEGISIYPDKQVVAVTGDGTNDAPALKQANVGFAMGIEGTEVAQDAANIILLSDNFADIVVAMKWGRNIYDSIQKFIQFQLTVNIVACVLACIGAVLFQESPLGAVQMLWVNLVMDSLASLALATEPPTEDLLERMPYGIHESIIKRGMWVNMLGQASYQLMITLIILFKGHVLFFDTAENNGQVVSPDEYEDVQKYIFADPLQLKIGWFAGCDKTQHYTLLFHAFVMMTLFNQVAARKLKAEMNLFEGVFNNWIFVLLVFIETFMQIILVQFGGSAFGCVPGGLTGAQHGWCILFGVIGWIWQLVLNLLARGPLAVSEEESIKPVKE